MRKITIIFCLLLSSFALPAQDRDMEWLTAVNRGGSSGFLRGASVALSHSTYAAVVTVPVVMGTVALARNDEELLRNTICVGATLAVNTALTLGVKYAVGRERPYERYPGVLDVPYPESSPAFPSGHTSLAFATATALTLEYPRWYVGVPLFVWASAVGYSRMNLGVHYPTDVLAGAVLGAASACATYWLNEWFWRKREDKQIIWW